MSTMLGGRSTVQNENASPKFVGHYLHGGQVLLQYEIAGRRVEELPSALSGESITFARSLRVGARRREAALPRCTIA